MWLRSQTNYVYLATILLCVIQDIMSLEDTRRQAGVTEEFCQSDYFNPRCFKNEVIVMKSATYGRMRVGKCITAEEVAEQGDAIDQGFRLFGCSKDVIEILNEKCSGRSECDVKVSDSSFGKVKQCLSGLYAHLEAEYHCIAAANEERSCSVVASKTPVHIIQSFNRSKICGTRTQPWIIEAPIGQKISFTLFDYSSSSVGTPQTQRVAAECVKYGMIVDKTAKVNKSICRMNDTPGQEGIRLYTSRGNSAYVYMTSSDDEGPADVNRRIILRVETVGCSDIIPPEDTWLKRGEDEIVIGCYSSRHSWRLSCKSGKWVGVLGNCSQDSQFEKVDVEAAQKEGISRNAQVLAMVAICGFTVAICLTIICIGAICFRRYTLKVKRNDYKTLTYSIGTTSQRQIPDPTGTVRPTLEQLNAGGPQSGPTYSVYMGQSETKEFMN